MRHLHSITVLCFFLLSSISQAQEEPYIEFAEKVLNFSTIRAVDGIVKHDFKFKNTGKVPLILSNVKSSCGCTVSEWTKEPVLPGKDGKISISFNPVAQSGAVSKSIQVISNASNSPIALSVQGVVIPAEKPEETFKFSIGDLRLETIYAALGEIYKGRTVEYSLKVFNNSNDTPLSITFGKVPAYLKITAGTSPIAPQQEGIIKIEYNSSLVNTWDYTVDRIDILLNGKPVQGNRLNITANIKEDFSALTPEQLALSAKAEFDSHEHNFGTISDKDIVEHTFHLKNTGKSDLYIRKVTASCGCTAVQPSKTTIAPGDSTEIKAVFNAGGRQGNQKKAITVITNDPRHSRSVLWINALVQKSQNTNP